MRMPSSFVLPTFHVSEHAAQLLYTFQSTAFEYHPPMNIGNAPSSIGLLKDDTQ